MTNIVFSSHTCVSKIQYMRNYGDFNKCYLVAEHNARRPRMRSSTVILCYYYYHCHHQLLNISPSTTAIIVDECGARVMLSLIEFLH